MNFFTRISAPFYSPEFYAAYARDKSAGIGMFYVFLLTLAGALAVLALVLLSNDLRGNVEDLPAVVRQLPEMTIKDGVLSTRPAGPQIIPVGTLGRVLIDDGKSLADFPAIKDRMSADGIAGVVVKDGVIAIGSNGDYRVNDFRQARDQVITRQQLSDLAAGIERAGWPLVVAFSALVIPLIIFIFNLSSVLVAGLVVWPLAALSGVTLDFDARMRLAAACLIPLRVIGILPLAAGPYYGACLAYLGFAVWSCRLNRAGGAA